MRGRRQDATRSTKVQGRVAREYFGCGELAEAIAQLDELDREQREIEREVWRREKSELKAFDDSVAEMCELADIVWQAALVVAGFHLHRGQWSRSNGRTLYLYFTEW